MAQEQQPTYSSTLIIDPDTNESIPEGELVKRRAWTEEVQRSNAILTYTDPITNTKVTLEEWVRREEVRVQHGLKPRHCADQQAVADLEASLSRQEWLKATPKRRSTAGTLDPAVGVAVGLPGSVGFESACVQPAIGKGTWDLAYSPFVPERVSEETSPFYSCAVFIIRHRRDSTSDLLASYQQLADAAEQLSRSTADAVSASSVLSALVEQVVAEFGVASIQSIDVREEAEESEQAFVFALVDRYGWDRDAGMFSIASMGPLSEDLTQALIRASEILGDDLGALNDDDNEAPYQRNGKRPASLALYDDSIDSPALMAAVMDADLERAIIASLKDMAIQDDGQGAGVGSSLLHGKRSDTILSNASSYDMVDSEDMVDREDMEDEEFTVVGSMSSASEGR